MNVPNRTLAVANRQGAVAVEFAFVFPLVLLFFTGLLVLSQAVMMRDTAQHAAFEGARRGVAIMATAEDCRKAVGDFLDKFKLTGAVVTVEPSELSPADDAITVTVAIPMRGNAWGGTGFLPLNFMIEKSITLNRRF